MTDLSRWIDRHAAFTPDKPAIRFEGTELTYAALADRVAAVARALKHRLGIGRGDRIAYLGYNGPDMLALLFACARLGAMLVPLNWRLAPPEHAFILGDAAVKALFAEAEFLATAETARPGEGCALIACGPGAAATGRPTLDALAAAAGGDDGNPHISHDCPLLVVYTSGTTGRPKGAVLTQGALFWNAVNSQHMHDLTSRDHVLTVLPLFHVGGLNIQTVPALHLGATVTLHRRFDADAVLRALAEDRPSLTVLVPATLQALIEHPGWRNADLSSLRAVATGSSTVPRGLIEAFHARGIPVLQVYGSTETCPIAVYLRAEEAFSRVGSTGKPGLHCEAKIVDGDGRPVPPGTAGEILVRGPNVMLEYWGDEAATAEALRGGWFHTGDIGRMDADGHVFFEDRKKNVIISGGENIYPAEVERVLREIPGVADGVVVGRSDERWGEVPVAVVTPAPGAALSREAVLAAFDGRLARFKHPRDVLFVDALPRNAMGKVQNFRVAQMVRDGAEGLRRSA